MQNPNKVNSVKVWRILGKKEIGFIMTIPAKDLITIRKDGLDPDAPFHIYVTANFPLTSSTSEFVGEKCWNHSPDIDTLLDVRMDCLSKRDFLNDSVKELHCEFSGAYGLSCLDKGPTQKDTDDFCVKFTSPIDYVDASEIFYCRIEIIDEARHDYIIPPNVEIYLNNMEVFRPISIIIYLEMPEKVIKRAKSFSYQHDLPLKSVLSDVYLTITTPKSMLIVDSVYNGIKCEEMEPEEEYIYAHAKNIIRHRGFFGARAFQLFLRALNVVYNEFQLKQILQRTICYWASDNREDFDLEPFKEVLNKLHVPFKMYLANERFFAGYPIIEDFTFSVELMVKMAHILSRIADHPIGGPTNMTTVLSLLLDDNFVKKQKKPLILQTQKLPQYAVDYKKHLILFVKNKLVSSKFLRLSKNEDLEKELPVDIVKWMDAVYGKCHHSYPLECKKLRCDYLKPNKEVDPWKHIINCREPAQTCTFCCRFKNINKLRSDIEILQKSK